MVLEYNFEYIVKLSVTLLYFLILIGIGVITSYYIKSIGDFFVAGKKLGYWLVSFSSRASGESGWLLLGLTGLGFLMGLHAYWVTLGEVLGVLIAWMFLVQRFKVFTDMYDSITIPDYLEDRFRDGLHIVRIVAALVLSVFVTMYVSGQYLAAGKAFQGFLGIDVSVGIVLGMAIVIVYSVAGGFLAIAWSDLLQGALMFFGLTLVPVVAVITLGGPAELFEAARAIDPVLLHVSGPPTGFWLQLFSILGLVAIGWGFLGSPQLFVRFIAVKNNEELVNGSMVAVLFTILTDFGAVTAGMCGRVLYENLDWMGMMYGELDEEMVFPLMVDDLLPLVLSAVFLAVVLAAIMSTADSLLVVASSSVVRDIYQQIFRPDASQRWLTLLSRLVTLVLALCALWFTLSFGTADIEYDNRNRPLTQLASSSEVDRDLLAGDPLDGSYFPAVRTGLDHLKRNLLSEADLIRTARERQLDRLGTDPLPDLRSTLIESSPEDPAYNRLAARARTQLDHYRQNLEEVMMLAPEDPWTEELDERLTRLEETGNWNRFLSWFDGFRLELERWLEPRRKSILSRHREEMISVMEQVVEREEDLERLRTLHEQGNLTVSSNEFGRFRENVAGLAERAEGIYSRDLLVMEETPPVFWFILIGWAGIAAAFCPLIMLSLFWRGVTRWGAVAGILSALVVVPMWVFAPIEWFLVVPGLEGLLEGIGVQLAEVSTPTDIIYEMIPGFVASFLSIVLVSWFTEAPEQVDEDLEEVRNKKLDVWNLNGGE